jgi:hypothetical protein
MSTTKPAVACPDCTGAMAHEVLPQTFERRRTAHILRCSTPGCGYIHPALASGKPKGAPMPKAFRDKRADCEALLQGLYQSAVDLYDIDEPRGEARDAVILRIKTTAKARTIRYAAHQLGIAPKDARPENITDIYRLAKVARVLANASAEQIRDWAKASASEAAEELGDANV